MHPKSRSKEAPRAGQGALGPRAQPSIRQLSERGLPGPESPAGLLRMNWFDFLRLRVGS